MSFMWLVQLWLSLAWLMDLPSKIYLKHQSHFYLEDATESANICITVDLLVRDKWAKQSVLQQVMVLNVLGKDFIQSTQIPFFPLT